MGIKKIILKEGDRYGLLVFTGNTFHDPIERRVVGEFICDCGQIVRVRMDTVARGKRGSCGCKSGAHNYTKKRDSWGEDYPFHLLLRRCIKIVKNSKIPCDITVEDIKNQYKLQDGKCFYTKQEIALPSSWTSKSSDTVNLISIDRIDSSQGYIVGNIQFTIKAVNIAKLNHTHEEFLEICHTIASNFPIQK